MIVPGAYFRDEAIWRGRVAAFTCYLKAALYETLCKRQGMHHGYPRQNYTSRKRRMSSRHPSTKLSRSGSPPSS